MLCVRLLGSVEAGENVGSARSDFLEGDGQAGVAEEGGDTLGNGGLAIARPQGRAAVGVHAGDAHELAQEPDERCVHAAHSTPMT